MEAAYLAIQNVIDKGQAVSCEIQNYYESATHTAKTSLLHRFKLFASMCGETMGADIRSLHTLTTTYESIVQNWVHPLRSKISITVPTCVVELSKDNDDLSRVANGLTITLQNLDELATMCAEFYFLTTHIHRTKNKEPTANLEALETLLTRSSLPTIKRNQGSAALRTFELLRALSTTHEEWLTKPAPDFKGLKLLGNISLIARVPTAIKIQKDIASLCLEVTTIDNDYFDILVEIMEYLTERLTFNVIALKNHLILNQACLSASKELQRSTQQEHKLCLLG